MNWDISSFSREETGEHTVSRQIEFCRQHIQSGAHAIGAFFGEKLVGIVVLTPEVRPRMAKLAYLQVSHDFRQFGIGAHLVEMAEDLARESGADQIYVSATPSESAVGLYKAMGFGPAEDPLPELYELEPDDIHMRKSI